MSESRAVVYGPGEALDRAPAAIVIPSAGQRRANFRD